VDIISEFCEGFLCPFVCVRSVVFGPFYAWLSCHGCQKYAILVFMPI